MSFAGRTAWAWSVLAVTSAFYFVGGNEADNDLWVHVFVGNGILSSGAVPRVDDLSYTVAGSPWVDHEWLIQAIFAAVFQTVGGSGLLLFKIAIGLFTAWMIWRMAARRSESMWVRGPVMVLALAVLARGFAVRPQIVTYAATALLLDWLDRSAARRPFQDLPPYAAGAAPMGVGLRRPFQDLPPYAAGAAPMGVGLRPPFQDLPPYAAGAAPMGVGLRPPSRVAAIVGIGVGFVFWANAHGGFAFGLGVLGLAAALPPWKGSGWRWTVLVTALLAACLNPYGPSLLAYIGSELGVPHPLTEWQPVALGDPAQRPFLLFLAALLVTLPFTRAWRRPWWTLLVAIVATMALRHQRHTPLLAITGASLLAEQMEGLRAWLGRRGFIEISGLGRAAISISLVGLALVQIASLARRLTADGARIVFEAADYPVGAVEFLRARELSGNLALPLDWGGYVLWHASPSIKVSLDGRFATVYPPRVVEDGFAFFRGAADPESHRLLEDYPTTLVLAPTPMRARSGWSLLYQDEVAQVWTTGAERVLTIGENPVGRRPFP